MPLSRLRLVHGPTPLVKRPNLDKLFDVNLWIKRDDATGGAEAGNKIRKLEFLLADALLQRADTVLTCGGIQSNHARATALVCAELGLSSVLYLRVKSGATGTDVVAPRERLPITGNVLLDRLAGAEIRLISPADYADRTAVLAEAATRLGELGKRPYVIPEGGSNGLGALGYVEAMREVREQLDCGLGGGPSPYDVVVHACGSGGTAAGVALGSAFFGVARSVRAVAVCDDAAYFERTIERIVAEARAFDPLLPEAPAWVVDDHARGPGYGVMDPEQRELLVEVTRQSGLVIDPVYTGKALHGLKLAVERGEIARGARVLFVHTGGLAGLLAEGEALEDSL
jgi:D-cysteine desulfhydrase